MAGEDRKGLLVKEGKASWIDFAPVPVLFGASIGFGLLEAGFRGPSPFYPIVIFLVGCIVGAPILFAFWTWLRVYPALLRLTSCEWREQMYLAGVPAEEYLRERIEWRANRCLLAGHFVSVFGMLIFCSLTGWPLHRQPIVPYVYYPGFVFTSHAVARIGVCVLLAQLCRARPAKSVLGELMPWILLMVISPPVVFYVIWRLYAGYFIEAIAIWVVLSLYLGFAFWLIFFVDKMWRRAATAYYTFD